MNTIVVNNQELEVMQLTPYAYMGGKGEKVLQIKVSAAVTGFDVLKELLDGNTGAIKYYEDEVLKCEYNGYSAFECTYVNDVFNIELKKGTLVDQVTALHNANERLLTANDTLERTSAMLVEQNEILAEQNIMLEFTMAEIMEVTIPTLIDEIMLSAAGHDEALAAQGEMLIAIDERLQFVEATITAGEVVEEPVTE